MSPFSWQGQNLCGLELAFIIDWRVVILLRESLIFKSKQAMTGCVFLCGLCIKGNFDGAVVLGAISGPLATQKK